MNAVQRLLGSLLIIGLSGVSTGLSAQNLATDPLVRQMTDRLNWEPGGRYFGFNDRGVVTQRSGQINTTVTSSIRMGNLSIQSAVINGHIGYVNSFSGHGYDAHAPFDNVASQSDSVTNQRADGSSTSVSLNWSGTENHPANGYDGPQGGGYPAPAGARDIYSYTISGSAFGTYLLSSTEIQAQDAAPQYRSGSSQQGGAQTYGPYIPAGYEYSPYGWKPTFYSAETYEYTSATYICSSGGGCPTYVHVCNTPTGQCPSSGNAPQGTSGLGALGGFSQLGDYLASRLEEQAVRHYERSAYFDALATEALARGDSVGYYINSFNSAVEYGNVYGASVGSVFERYLIGPALDLITLRGPASGTAGNVVKQGGRETESLINNAVRAGEKVDNSAEPVIRWTQAESGSVAKNSQSRYEDLTELRSRYQNRSTDVTKVDFEKNLLDSGYARSVSGDGKVVILEKDGSKYVLRDNATSTGGATADYYQPGSTSIDLKIRLGDSP